jgi:hypothetical protein
MLVFLSKIFACFFYDFFIHFYTYLCKPILGQDSRYWAGTVVTEPRCFIFDNSGTAGMTTNNRARAFAVRCIKD